MRWGMTGWVSSRHRTLEVQPPLSFFSTQQADLLLPARCGHSGSKFGRSRLAVNQPLAAIVTNGNACARRLEADPPNLARAKSTIGNIVEDAMRASQVVARIRALVTRAPSAKARAGRLGVEPGRKAASSPRFPAAVRATDRRVARNRRKVSSLILPNECSSD